MDLRHVERLRRARDLLAVKGFDTRETVLSCYSGAGFSPELQAAQTLTSVLSASARSTRTSAPGQTETSLARASISPLFWPYDFLDPGKSPVVPCSSPPLGHYPFPHVRWGLGSLERVPGFGWAGR